MSEGEKTKEQYDTSELLEIRLRLHQEYSTNRQGFSNWLFSHYNIIPGCRVLELGCGTGDLWQGRVHGLPAGVTLTLTDLSEGMVTQVSEKYKEYSQVSVQQTDAMDLPFSNTSFDLVIANHMLHHVPVVSTALAEVRRVLKPNGVFYASANGEKGMSAWLRRELQKCAPEVKAFSEVEKFTLQNGETQMLEYFPTVISKPYPDGLEITKTQDLIGWLQSVQSIERGLEKLNWDKTYDYFEAIRLQHGYIEIPKEVGLLIGKNI